MIPLDNPTVFVVEDEPETRNSFAALVSSMNLAVEVFASGEEFLQCVDGGRPGCTIVDLRLGEMDGLELHHRLVEAGYGLPVILISAYLTVQIVARALEQGVFRVLEKPYPNDELVRAVQDAIERDGELREQKLSELSAERRLEVLDKRERRTLDLIFAGHPNKSIVRLLKLSRRTIDRVRSSILAKTGFLSFMELAAIYGKAGAGEGAKSGKRALEETRSPHSVLALPKAKTPRAAAIEEASWRMLCCDLHDGPAQYVSAALLRLQTMEVDCAMVSEARGHLQMAGALLDVALRDIRDIIAGRSPAGFMQGGIMPAVKRLVQEVAKASGIKIKVVGTLGRKRLTPLLETAVYRILQESLNNAVRHSGSERICVALVRNQRTLRFEVRDWGSGFDCDAVGGEHRGLRGIRERAALLGGSVSIESKPGWGTLVTTELPI